MSDLRIAILIGVMALSIMATRFGAFIMFPSGKKVPKFIQYLGEVLPYSAMGLLIVYCLKDMSFVSLSNWVPYVVAVVVVALLQWWKSNTILSIIAGTATYMILLQVVFK